MTILKWAKSTSNVNQSKLYVVNKISVYRKVCRLYFRRPFLLNNGRIKTKTFKSFYSVKKEKYCRFFEIFKIQTIFFISYVAFRPYCILETTNGNRQLSDRKTLTLSYVDSIKYNSIDKMY